MDLWAEATPCLRDMLFLPGCTSVDEGRSPRQRHGGADVRTQHTAPVAPCRQKQTGVSCQTFTFPWRKRASHPRTSPERPRCSRALEGWPSLRSEEDVGE